MPGASRGRSGWVAPSVGGGRTFTRVWVGRSVGIQKTHKFASLRVFFLADRSLHKSHVGRTSPTACQYCSGSRTPRDHGRRRPLCATGLELATASAAWLACPSESFRRAVSPSYQCWWHAQHWPAIRRRLQRKSGTDGGDHGDGDDAGDVCADVEGGRSMGGAGGGGTSTKGRFPNRRNISSAVVLTRSLSCTELKGVHASHKGPRPIMKRVIAMHPEQRETSLPCLVSIRLGADSHLRRKQRRDDRRHTDSQ